MGVSLPHAITSDDGPRELTIMHASGAPRDSGRGSCYVILIGYMTSKCNTTHLLLIRIHLSRNQREHTRFSHTGCHIQTVTLLREVTLSYPIPSLRILLCFWSWVKRLQRSGCENWTGLP